MNTFNTIWDIYRSCWSEVNANQRTQKLKNILTSNFEYLDPNFKVNGYLELSNYMKEFQEQFSGASFVTKNIHTHHNRCLVHWSMVNTKNETLSHGTSYVLYEDNKLKQITGFFNEE